MVVVMVQLEREVWFTVELGSLFIAGLRTFKKHLRHLIIIRILHNLPWIEPPPFANNKKKNKERKELMWLQHFNNVAADARWHTEDNLNRSSPVSQPNIEFPALFNCNFCHFS